MTLRGVIKSLLHGSGDAEALLADDGYGDLPPEMFSQALSSYADTAPMEEADALTPVFAQLDEGSPSDVFAVLEEQPLDVGPVYDPTSIAAEASTEAADDLDEFDDLGDFGSAADVIDAEALDTVEDAVDAAEATEPGFDADIDTQVDDIEDPFADTVDEAIDDAVDTAEEFEDFFATEPEAGGDDPGDLDLDF